MCGTFGSRAATSGKVVADQNVMRVRGVERRTDLSGGEASEGRTP
jgi:hypothetical protein